MSFLSQYGMLLDQGRLEEWVELFEPQAEYKVYSRENEELGLPAPLIWCDNRAMLSDRIQSYRNVNEHNFHWPRHIIGMPQILHADPESLHFQAGYSLFQTNFEGDMVEKIHKAHADGIGAVMINAGAWTHYSYGIRDALAILKCPIIEVHMSNIHAREAFRHQSVIAEIAKGQIAGFGVDSYLLGLRAAVSAVQGKA
jgi:3-dehydroquinate dehydratase-2